MAHQAQISGMDDDALRDATERWVDAGVVDPETAAAIREFERGQVDGEGGQLVDEQGSQLVDEQGNRLVVALSLMGAVLVGAGLLTYLASNWGSLSTATRTVVLVAAPPLAGGVGIRLARGRYPQVGHGLWFLGAAFLGPSLVLLADLYAPDLGEEWLLFAWAVGALPAGHAFDSRPTTALGLLVALAAVFVAAPGDLAPFVAAFAGAVVVAAGLAVRPRSDRLAGVYRIVGLVPVGLTLLLLGLREGQYRLIRLEADPTLVAALLAAAVAVGLTLAGWNRGDLSNADALAVTAAGVAAATGLGAVAVTPPLPALASFLLVHAALLGLALAVVLVGVASRSRALVNLVAAGFLLQVVTFLFTTVAQVLEGALTLVVAGVVLLAVGLALEQGRRRLLARIGAG